MPDDNGKLSKEEHAQAVHWLNEKVPKAGICAVCGHKPLVLGKYVGSMLISLIEGRSYPALVLHCAKCGYYRLHSAILAGVVERESEPKTNDDGKSE